MEDRVCRECGRKMHVCDHRRHPIFTLEGPREVVCRLVKCPNRGCPGHHRTLSPEREATICLPRSILGWDALLSSIASESPGVPHRYCQNHFLRDVVQPVLEQDILRSALSETFGGVL